MSRRKEMEATAKELNKVLGLDPQIDAKKSSDEDLTKMLLLAGEMVIPGQDPVSEASMDLLARLAEESGEKPAKSKKAKKTEAVTETVSEVNESVEESTKPEIGSLYSRIEAAKKLSELKDLAQSMSKKVKKLAAEASGLQAGRELKKLMLAEALKMTNSVEAVPVAEVTETPKTGKVKKSKKQEAVPEVVVTVPEVKKSKKEKTAIEQVDEKIEQATEQITEVAGLIESLRNAKTFVAMKKVWKASELLQDNFTPKQVNGVKEDPKLAGKLRKKMILLLESSVTGVGEQAEVSEETKPEKIKKSKKPEVTEEAKTSKQSHTANIGKSKRREMYIRVAELIKECKHNKQQFVDILMKEFKVTEKIAKDQISYSKNPLHTRCGVVAVIGKDGILRLSKVKAEKSITNR